MKNLITIITMCLFVCCAAIAQSGADRKKAAEEKAQKERTRSLGGKRTGNELKDDAGSITPANDLSDGNTDEPQKDQKTSVERGVVQSNEDQNIGASGDTTTRQNASPAIIQNTTSASGSPSVLSGENGRRRDGTGNVQRAEPNMAGAKIPKDFNIDQKNTEQNENTQGESSVRQEEEVPARITSPGSENNEVRDQAGKNEKSKRSAKEKNNDKKKSEKKKNRKGKDSGK